MNMNGRTTCTFIYVVMALAFIGIGLGAIHVDPDSTAMVTEQTEFVNQCGRLLLGLGVFLLLLIGVLLMVFGDRPLFVYDWFIRILSSYRPKRWKRLLKKNLVGRDVQMLSDGVLYRGRIASVEMGVTPSKHVCIRCDSSFRRVLHDADWKWENLPMVIQLDCKQTRPILCRGWDGIITFLYSYAEDEAVIILPVKDTLPLPQEQDASGGAKPGFTEDHS